MKSSSPPVLTGATLSKATALGFWLFILFGLGALLAYGVSGLAGWEDTARILFALLIGPLIAVVGIGIGWLFIRPYWLMATKPQTSTDSMPPSERQH